ncbi:CvfD/Ygs/GSP13 family RNA-binding post-transcriptional regulator [Enterococcus nangangensis]
MYKIGMIKKGTITGIQPYGAFVSLGDDQQGLIHVSEIQHGYTKNIHDYLQVGQEVEVQVIDIDAYSQKISLSMRTLQEKFQPHTYKKKHYYTSKRKKTGFAPIAVALPTWINETLQYLRENK